MSSICALLLVDVVDSTELTQRLGDAETAALWAAHDRVARDLLGAWRGREIDKTDGFLLLFADVADAAGYALAYHQALAALRVPLQARAGLHLGPVILRENSVRDVELGAKPIELEGLAKSTAARVMSLARGGQTLLTADARAALGATRLHAHSHGHWRMKGVAEPIELFELGTAGAAFMPPPDSTKVYRVARKGAQWVPVRQIDNNLPQQVTSFIGRERELAEVIEGLSRTRLCTLLGIGGLGKTRLSLEVASSVIGDFPDGVWFVELAPLADPRQVPQAVASALRIKEEAGLGVIEALVLHVRERRLLIVLDNCEHLLHACASLARQLLQSGPDLKVLATSREPLHVAGETCHPMPTLAVPDSHAPVTVESLARNEAVRLFSDRAAAARPAFRIDNGNAATVADICRRLDGIPLALELAAARVRTLPVATIAQRLTDRFHLLTGGDRTALPRQQTLRALIDWSHDLLTLPERALLRRLAVFAGGWTLETAEAVGAGNEVDPGDVLDLLSQLVDKSLVAVDMAGQRYRLLETMRAYALQRLDESGEGDPTRTRHLEFFLALAEQAATGLWSVEQGAWVARLDLERENLLAAAAWCDGGSEHAPQGLRLVSKLQLYWLPSGQIELGYRLTLEALARPGAQQRSETRCGALYAASQLAYFMGRFDDVRTHGEQSLSIARELGNRARAADALLMLGYAADESKQPAAALPRFEESIALARALADQGRLSYALNALAGHYSSSDPGRSVPLFEESLALAREVGDRDSASVTLQNIVRALVTLGREAEALAPLAEALEIGTAIGSRRIMVYVLDVCVAFAAWRADWSRAAWFSCAADAQYERLGLRRLPGDDEFIAPAVARTRAHLDATAYAQEQAAARGVPHEQAMAVARSWLAGQM